MKLSLSLLTIALGAGLIVPQIYGLANPKGFTDFFRKFPRNYPAGIVLMLLATGWFVWNVNNEPIADFSAYKSAMLFGFAAVGVGACIFVRDFLAVRAVAVILLLLAKLMVDTGRPHLSESPLVLVVQTWTYVMVVAGIWFTVMPWKLRDLLEFTTANETRVRIGSGIRLLFAIFILGLGLTAFRGM